MNETKRDWECSWRDDNGETHVSPDLTEAEAKALYCYQYQRGYADVDYRHACESTETAHGAYCAHCGETLS